MVVTFEQASKYFFWIAGVVTALGALPIMLSPVSGLQLTTGLSYFEQSPQVTPIIGHWGIMVAGIGVLLFLAATNKAIRMTTVIFSTLEKSYMVGFAAYCFLSEAPYASSYLIALIGDSLMVIGGVWYLLSSRRLKQD